MDRGSIRERGIQENKRRVRRRRKLDGEGEAVRRGEAWCL